MLSIVVAAVLLVCCLRADAAWTSVQQLGTLVFGLDALTVDTGVVGGLVNGPGNVIYQYTANGDAIRPILLGTAQGQPFLIMNVQSQSENGTAAFGIGYGRNFPGAMFTLTGGATWLPSSTHTTDVWGFYQDGTRTYDNSAYVVTGDWVNYCNTPPCTYGTGAGFSTDGGDVYTMSAPGAWPYDAWARYSAFFNTTVGYVSGGYWPLSAERADILIGDEEETEGRYPLSQHVSVRMSMNNGMSRHEMVAKAGRPVKSAGYHAFVAKTTDGGQTYEAVYSAHDAEFYFNQIQFLSDSVGLVVGEGSRAVILRTTDGGQTWMEVFTSEYSLVALKMVNSLEGWAAGAVYGRQITAYAVRTSDGGLTWTEYPVDDLPFSFWNIDGIDPANVLATAFNQAGSALLRYNP